MAMATMQRSTASHFETMVRHTRGEEEEREKALKTKANVETNEATETKEETNESEDEVNNEIAKTWYMGRSE